jgi:hypothetical protein
MKHCLRGGAIMVPAVMAALSFGCSSSSKGGATGTSTDMSTGTGTSTTGPSFSTVYGPIISQSCTNPTCHASGANSLQGALDMSSRDVAYKTLVGVPAAGELCGTSGLIRVVPGSSSTSLLYLKVSETQPPCGARMPFDATTPLSPTQVALIQTWINGGANE